MNSLKNTVVIVLLLGVSYGVFQLVNAPKNTNVANEEDPVDLQIEDFGEESADEAELPSDATNDLADTGDQLQSQLPELPDFVPRTDSPANDKQNISQNMAQNESLPKTSEWSQPDFEKQSKQFVNEQLPKNNFTSENPDKQTFTGPLDSPNKQSPPANEGQAFADPNDLVPIPDNSPIESQQNLLEQNIVQQKPNAPVMSSAPPKPLPFQYVPTAEELEKIWPQARKLVSEQNFAGALALLSKFSRSKLTDGQRVELMNWLDSLAGKVVYSPEHLLTRSPYLVRQGDTLASLASQWRVPPALIHNINQSAIGRSGELVPGTKLKQVQGPFRAEIDSSTVSSNQGEMTIFLGDLYAGRFQLDFGADAQIKPGEYTVQMKTDKGRAYQNSSGQVVQAGSSENPYGNFWMDLGGGVCIHARNSSDNRGCIRVNDADVADVFGILDSQSQVIIR